MSERPTRSAGRSCETVASFLLKTYQILEHPQFEYMISWEKDGIGFVVKDVVGFTKEILPKYFRHANFSSFVRQLNMYDFHKVKQENDNLVFKNPLFRRGEQSQLKDIKRKASKKVFSHRRMPYERNHSQSQKYFSTLKALKKSVEAEINQSNLNFEKSLSLLKENSQSNKFKLKYIHELQECSVATPLDSLFMLKEECYRYFSKLEEWLTEVVDAETKKQQIIQNCMSQLQKNKEEKKSQQSFQSFPIITNPPFENYS